MYTCSYTCVYAPLYHGMFVVKFAVFLILVTNSYYGET